MYTSPAQKLAIKKFGQALRQEMLASNHRVQDVALAIGVKSETTVYNILSGKRPSKQTYEALRSFYPALPNIKLGKLRNRPGTNTKHKFQDVPTIPAPPLEASAPSFSFLELEGQVRDLVKRVGGKENLLYILRRLG